MGGLNGLSGRSRKKKQKQEKKESKKKTSEKHKIDKEEDFKISKKSKSGDAASSSEDASAKAKTGFEIFCNTNRQKVQQANPKATPAEVVMVMVKMWQGLEPENKEK
eukprot:748683-Hanusia_phi.AAC.4